eukprot:m.31854 g.31854  ORF g.31854 m.31854 type:complete len:98 (-) comp8354_c0_seq3:603-896(-)
MRISKSESLYIVDGIKSNVRQDGRTCDAYREFQLKVDAVSNANGSAKVEIGNTVVLAVVKANTGEPGTVCITFSSSYFLRLSSFCRCSRPWGDRLFR